MHSVLLDVGSCFIVDIGLSMQDAWLKVRHVRLLCVKVNSWLALEMYFWCSVDVNTWLRFQMHSMSLSNSALCVK